jgi:hypothetical protein
MAEIPDSSRDIVRHASEGRLPKHVLAGLLPLENRGPFLDACNTIEKRYTEECTASGDPCLESGCALEGEVCLQPLLRAGDDYHKACAAEWLKIVVSRP